MSRIIPLGEELPPLDVKPLGKILQQLEAEQAKKPKGKQRFSRAKAVAERFGVLNNFVDLTLATLSGAEAATWLTLFRDSRKGVARTAMSDLARRAGCTRRQIVRAVKALELRGLLTVVERGGFRRGMSSYTVHPIARSPTP